jgi:hypothetical protein
VAPAVGALHQRHSAATQFDSDCQALQAGLHNVEMHTADHQCHNVEQCCKLTKC